MRRFVAAVVALGLAAGAWGLAAGDSSGDMVSIPAGWGWMGADDRHPDEQPRRLVYLGGFEIDRTEVTNAAYRLFVQATAPRPPVYWDGTDPPAGTADHPVVGVSWAQADAYCRWRSKRLPTEAEWERACRGAEGLAYPWGDEWQVALANVTSVDMRDRDDAWPVLAGTAASPAGLRPVGSFPEGSSWCGALDMAGNASEWVADWYDPAAYRTLPSANPLADAPPWNHVVRGSAWLLPHDRPDLIADVSRCSHRDRSHVYDDPRIGFRCARSVGE